MVVVIKVVVKKIMPRVVTIRIGIGDCRVAFATKSVKTYDKIVHFLGFDRCAERTNEFTFGHTGHMDIILGRYGC